MCVVFCYANNTLKVINQARNMQIPAHRLPHRDYQKDIIQAFNDPKIDELLLVIARRGAKTTTTYSEGIVPELVKQVQTAVAVYPTAKMGFDNFWTNIEDDGFKTLDHMPKGLLSMSGQSNSDDDMRQTLINGSIFRLLGATNVEALRGANGKIYWFDEFADQPIEAVNVVAPITERNKGKRIYTGTPKIDSVNGETMRRMHEAFKKDTTGTKYTCYIDATHYMTPEELEKTRQGYILRNGNDFKFRQEMLLDWGQASASSYYGEIMANKDKNGTIGEWPHNPAYPVYTVWDLGRADTLVIGFFQFFKGKPRLIEVYETQNFGLDSIIPVLQSKPYNYGWHFLPHDGTVASLNDNVSRIGYLHSKGISNVSTLKREGVNIGIGRVKDGLPGLLINEGMTGNFSRRIRNYKRKINPLTGDYIGPDHKTESHIADMIRYLFAALAVYWNEKGEFMYSPETSQQEYASDLATVTFY
jgi:hypothetical protein